MSGPSRGLGDTSAQRIRWYFYLFFEQSLEREHCNGRYTVSRPETLRNPEKLSRHPIRQALNFQVWYTQVSLTTCRHSIPMAWIFGTVTVVVQGV